jgi:hypothetical protein
MRIPFNLNDIADKNPAKVGYSTSAEARYMERWKKTHTDLLADPSEGPGMLGAPFHERFSAGLNMLADIGSAKMAGAKATGSRGQKSASVPRSGRSMKKPLVSIPQPNISSTVDDLKGLQYSRETIPNLVGNGERPLFGRNLPKDVNPQQIEAFLAKDRVELETVAKLMDPTGQTSSEQAAKKLAERMVELIVKARTPSSLQQSGDMAMEMLRGQKTIPKRRLFGLLEGKLTPEQQLQNQQISDAQDLLYLKTLNPGSSLEKLDSLRTKGGVAVRPKSSGLEALRSRLPKDLLASLEDNNLAGENIGVHLGFENVRGGGDTVFSQGNTPVLRLNSTVIDLARRGIYQKPVETPDIQQQIYPTSPLDFYQKFMAPQNKSSGGVIYASQGTLVNYQPRGTDTVPAMLTPGEFVVNRASTQKHLPLLQSINSGNYENGGIVSYYQRGRRVAWRPGQITRSELDARNNDRLTRNREAYDQREADRRERDRNNTAQRTQLAEDRRARSISGMSVQTRGGSYTQPAMSSSQAQPSQPQQTTQSTIAQAIINVAQAVISIANATTSSSSSNNRQTGTPSYMTSSINGPRTQRVQDYYEARRIARASREQEQHETTLYRRRNRRPSDGVAYQDLLASRNAPVSATNQNPQAQNSILNNLLQAIQNMLGSAQTTATSPQSQQTGTPRYLTSSINTPGVQRVQDFFERRRMNQEAQQEAERARRAAARAVSGPIQQPGPAQLQQQAQPQQNNMWITLNNDISRFNSALNIAASALGQFNQQLAAGITQNSVSNNGNPGNVNFNAVSQFTSTFQSFIDQLRNINPVINMTGTHTVVVEFNGAGVFAGMEDKVKQFVVSQINQSMDQLSRGTEGAIPTYQV